MKRGWNAVIDDAFANIKNTIGDEMLNPVPDWNSDPQPIAKIVNISPELASAMLQRNIANNRGYRPRQAQAYAKDMKSGRWKPNGEPIKILVNGELADGQHRLNAIVISGVTVPMMVVYNIPLDAVSTIDIGMRRTAGDMLRMSGISNSNHVASAARLLLQYERNKWGNNPEDINTTDVIESGVVHQRMAAHHQMSHKCWRNFKISVSAMLVFLHLVECNGWTKDEIDAYCDNLSSGAALQDGDPRLALRNFTVNNSMAGIEQRRLHLYAAIVAFNDYVSGNPRKLFRPSQLKFLKPPQILPRRLVKGE